MDAVKFLNGARLDAGPANASQFFLDIAGTGAETFAVLEFEGREHGISRDYQFDIRVQTDASVDPRELVGKPGNLAIVRDVDRMRIHGWVSEVTQIGRAVDGEEYIVVLSSPLSRLRLGARNRVFLNKDARQILEEVLLGANLDSPDFEFRIKESYAVREFTVQYGESDYDFATRLMARHGLFFTFEQAEDRARMIVHDRVDELPLLDGGASLMYQVQTGASRHVESVFALRRRARLQTDNVRVKDYNYRTPEAALDAAATNGSAVTGGGTDYRYGENYKTLDEGDRVARIRQQSIDWQRETFVIESDCRGLAPGMRFTLTGHPVEELNVEYLVVEVEHHGDQRAAQPRGQQPGGMTYRNRALLIRGGVPFRMPVQPAPAVHGIFTAQVETTGGEYAYLDEQGRYRIRMPFDLGSSADGEASHPVRLLQPYAGKSYGMHFPLHAGTEVALTCVNGDLDRPVLLGALANPDTPGPVSATNHSQNVLRTWGGNEMLMEDRQGEERVELFTRGRKNILTLDAGSQGHKVRWASEEGEMEAFAAKSILIESGDTQTVRSGNDHNVTVENAQRVMTRNKEIELQAATDVRVKAGDNVLVQAETSNIELTAGKDMVIDVTDNMSVQVRNDDLEFNVLNGKVGIQAARSITVKGEGGGTIHIGQSGASVEISADGDLSVSGSTVTISGAAINIKGQSIGSN